MNSRILAKPPDLLNSSEFLGSCPKFLSKAVSFPDAQNVAQG